MRVNKTIKGELYSFYVQFIFNQKTAKVRYFQSDFWTICNLSEDLNYILLPKGQFIFDNTEVEKLKLNKRQRLEAIDYYENNNHI